MMAGFVKDAVYNWVIKDEKGDVYAKLRKHVAKQAYQIFKDMKKEKHNLKLYCNDELVGK